eukprot:g7142.t1 g7142   contig23:1958901-1959552(+)
MAADKSTAEETAVAPNKKSTAFRIKQILTGIHFLSLLSFVILALINHPKTVTALLLTIASLGAAYVMPPMGMIQPEDAPEYAKGSMSYLPERPGSGSSGGAGKKKSDKQE